MKREEWVRWSGAAAGALVVTISMVWLFRLPPAKSLPESAARRLPPPVQIAQPGPGNRWLQEETEIRDLRPLFLPTDRNASLAPPRREPGRSFLEKDDLRPSLMEFETSITQDLPPVATIDGRPARLAQPVDALVNQAMGGSLVGYGRQPAALPPFAQRGGFIEIVSIQEGDRVVREALPQAARPPGDKTWDPVEFLAVVDASGLFSPLVVTVGSRIEEVDLHFREFLTQTFRVGERLAPGFYRITVAP